MKKIEFFVGSYAEKDKEGITNYSIDESTLQYCKLASLMDIEAPSYIAVDHENNRLYSVMEVSEYNNEYGGAVISCTYDKQDGIRRKVGRNVKGALPCYILYDEDHRYIFTANYSSGSLCMYKLDKERNATQFCCLVQHEGIGPNKQRQEGPHVHFCCLTEDKSGLWVVDLGIDTIKYYKIDLLTDHLIPAAEKDIHLPKGVGPRHFVLGKHNKNVIYVACELSSEVYVIDINHDQIINRYSTLPRNNKVPSTCSAIRIAEDGRFIYVSNRGHNSIAVFKVNEDSSLDLVQIESSGGENPRDFNLYRSLLFVANLDTNTISIFKVNSETGRIKPTRIAIPCYKPSCIVF